MEKLIVEFIFITVGVGFFYFGYLIWNSNRRIQAKGTQTKAKIIDFVIEKSKDNGGYLKTYHFPVVRFIDKNCITTTQKLNTTTNPKRINELIDIIYLKNDSSYEIIINSKFYKTYFPIIFLIMGILYLIIGVVWLINKFWTRSDGFEIGL